MSCSSDEDACCNTAILPMAWSMLAIERDSRATPMHSVDGLFVRNLRIPRYKSSLVE
jgi:hypothetical protein